MTQRGAPKSSRSREALEGVRVQPRDRSIVWMAGANGWVTMPQLKLFAFDYLDGTGWLRTVSEQAAYRRLRKLCGAGFLEHQYTWVGDHGVYRATKRGLALVGLDLAPASLDKRDYEHDLQVVDLALEITDYGLDGWITERMIRSRLKPGMSIGRVPDGLLLSQNGERWAIELEVSGKESQRYYEACDKYAGRHRADVPEDSRNWDLGEQLDDYLESDGGIDGVVWYFYSDKKRLRALAEAQKVVDGRANRRQRTEHLHLRFHGAAHPESPPMNKWEEQQRRKQEAEEQQRREQEEKKLREQEEQRKREEEATQQRLYQEALNYLTEDEQRRVRDKVAAELAGVGRSRTDREQELREAIIEAASAKYQAEQEKEEKRRRRKDAVKSWLTGS